MRNSARSDRSHDLIILIDIAIIGVVKNLEGSAIALRIKRQCATKYSFQKLKILGFEFGVGFVGRFYERGCFFEVVGP